MCIYTYIHIYIYTYICICIRVGAQEHALDIDFQEILDSGEHRRPKRGDVHSECVMPSFRAEIDAVLPNMVFFGFGDYQSSSNTFDFEGGTFYQGRVYLPPNVGFPNMSTPEKGAMSCRRVYSRTVEPHKEQQISTLSDKCCLFR